MRLEAGVSMNPFLPIKSYVIFLPQGFKISPNQALNPAREPASTKGVFDFGRAVV
jgi:hypothetical protein